MAQHRRQQSTADASIAQGGLTLALDVLALLAAFVLVWRAMLLPDDPLWFAALATVGCAWIALRTVAVCGCGSRWWPAPGLMFLLLLLVTNHIGAFYYFHEPLFSPPWAAWLMIWACNLAYLAFAAGTWAYTRGSGLRAGELIDSFYGRPLTFTRNNDMLLWPSLLIFGIGSCASLVLMGGKFPIVDVLRTMASGDFFGVRFLARAARAEVYTTEDRPFQGLIEQFRSAVVPMMVLLWYTSWQVTQRQLYRWLWIGGLVISIVLLTGNLQRSALVLFVLQLAMTAIMLRPTRPNLRWLYGSLGLFLLLVLLSLLLGRGAVKAGLTENLTRQVSLAAFRLYGANSRTSVKVFELFPGELAFRNGATWVTGFAGLLPGRNVTLSQEIFSYFGKGSGGAGVSYVAEMWANGGWVSVLLASFLTGFALQWVNLRWLALSERTPQSLVIMALLFFSLGLMGWGGMLTPVNRGLFTFLALNWVLRLLLRHSPAREAGARRWRSGTAAG